MLTLLAADSRPTSCLTAIPPIDLKPCEEPHLLVYYQPKILYSDAGETRPSIPLQQTESSEPLQGNWHPDLRLGTQHVSTAPLLLELAPEATTGNNHL